MEKTFTSYTTAQGKIYAKTRLNYAPSVYDTILTHHTTTGGALNTLLDVGCGPGIVAYSLYPHFTTTIGLDPGQGMITAARSLLASILDDHNDNHGESNDDDDDAKQKKDKTIKFEISSAEQLGSNLTPPIAPNSIDLITVGNAAHWFDMAPFWRSAARILKPGGTVAIWTTGGSRIHPSMPNAAAIQADMDRIEKEYLHPYFEPGNWLTRNGYRDLVMPWDAGDDVPGGEEGDGSVSVNVFDRETFVRREWEEGGEEFLVGQHQELSLDAFETILGTGSPVTRWREAHPECVGTEKDVLRVMRRAIEKGLREAGVKEGEERVRGSIPGVILLFKKKVSS